MMTIMMMKVMVTMMMIMSRMMMMMMMMMMMPEARRQGVTLWRLLVTLAHNCCKRQLQAEERRSG